MKMRSRTTYVIGAAFLCAALMVVVPSWAM